MTLDKLFCLAAKNGNLQTMESIRVISNGSGYTNVPKGEKGLVKVCGADYEIKWDNGMGSRKNCLLAV